MREAFLWGTVAGASLVIGGVVALRVSLTRRILGLIMAFGAGVLVSAVAYELVQEAFETSAGDGGVALGLLVGSVVFYGADTLIDHFAGSGGEQSTDSSDRAKQAGRALVLGIILDGIPESIVLGASLIAGTGVGIPVLVAIAVSNVPEALSASEDLANAGIRRSRILGLWFGVAVVSALAAGVGFAVLSGAEPGAVAFIQAFAAGAILAMLSESMVPEAQEIGGRAVGLATSLGFAVAASLSFVT